LEVVGIESFSRRRENDSSNFFSWERFKEIRTKIEIRRKENTKNSKEIKKINLEIEKLEKEMGKYLKELKIK
jgi:cell division protein FtsB